MNIKILLITIFLSFFFFSYKTNSFTLNFEQVEYNYHSWNNEANAEYDDWKRTTSKHYDGSYSLASGQENDGKYSCFSIKEYFYGDGWIKFYHKESTESGDKLKFYVDGSKKNERSGENNRADKSRDISSGTHTFKWCYVKDGSDSSGDNRVRVDNIRFNMVYCNPTWGDGEWLQTYSCKLNETKGVHNNIKLYNSIIDIKGGEDLGIDLSNYYIKFYESTKTGTTSIPSKINIPTDSKIDNSTTSRYYESFSYGTSSKFSSCPAGMYVMNKVASDFDDYQGSSKKNVGTSGTYYCGN